jgi:hypothetical protein
MGLQFWVCKRVLLEIIYCFVDFLEIWYERHAFKKYMEMSTFQLSVIRNKKMKYELTWRKKCHWQRLL